MTFEAETENAIMDLCHCRPECVEPISNHALALARKLDAIMVIVDSDEYDAAKLSDNFGILEKIEDVIYTTILNEKELTP